MEDQQIRVALQIYLTLVVFIIFSFTGKLAVFLIGLLLANGLAYAFMPALNSILSLINTLIYGSAGTDNSYEGRFYQTDLDQARKMVRESRWEKAISCYRKIVEQAPEKVEARFELAKVYRTAGYTGLALLEYETIKDLRDKIGEHHPFVLESERMIEELRKMVAERDTPSLPLLQQR